MVEDERLCGGQGNNYIWQMKSHGNATLGKEAHVHVVHAIGKSK
jgi:hypothetical protein